jgi:hypothetical protein
VDYYRRCARRSIEPDCRLNPHLIFSLLFSSPSLEKNLNIFNFFQLHGPTRKRGL